MTTDARGRAVVLLFAAGTALAMLVLAVIITTR